MSMQLIHVKQFSPLVRNRKGRKRKSGYRKPSGDLILEDPRLTVLAQPHRKGLPAKQAGDQRLENRLGELHFIGAITSAELAAGRWYQRVVARWRAVMSVADPALQPIPGRGGDIPEEEAQERVKEYNAARAALKDAGASMEAVDNFVLLNQPLPERGFRMVVKGLRVLAKHRQCAVEDEGVG